MSDDRELAERTVREAYGASQVEPFDYCPKLGFREYWYPGIEARRVRSKPVHLTMLGDELVVFRDTTGKVVALGDWCPHRGARLSLGVCEFKGTVICPYHGYVFDGAGQCVAGLIERPDSPFVGKLRARVYPTEERMGIVFVWMGETAPVPLHEDLPAELSDSEMTGTRFTRVKGWEANWTEPMAQGIDFHEFYLHRGVNVWRLFNYRLPFFRAKVVYTGGVKITSEGDTWVIIGASIHLRWNVPVTEHDTRVWTFTLVRRPRTRLHAAWQTLWYHTYRKPSVIVATNEKEDLIVFKRERINLERPQKLGPLDVGLIYFRRHLALRARDYQRLGAARGTLKQPPGHASARAAEPADALS